MNSQEIVSILMLVVTAVAIIPTLIQLHKSGVVKRTEYISSLLEKLRTDKNLAEIKYRIEDDEKWYGVFPSGASSHGFASKEDEKAFDNYFFFMNYICYLYNSRKIRENEFSLFEYLVNRTCKNESAQKYFAFIDGYSKQTKSVCSFKEIIDYAKNKGFFK